MKTEAPKLVKIDHKGLVKVLMQLRGATPATIEVKSLLKMNKKNNPYHDSIYKTQRSRVFINFNYANAVNKRLESEGKEPNFQAQPRRWGVKLDGVPIVMHNEEAYLETRFLDYDPNVEYWYNSEPIDIEIFKQYLPPRSTFNKENQGVDNEIILRDFKISNIQSIVFKKTKYIVV